MSRKKKNKNKKKQQNNKIVNIKTEEQINQIISSDDLQKIIVSALVTYDSLKENESSDFFKALTMGVFSFIKFLCLFLSVIIIGVSIYFIIINPVIDIIIQSIIGILISIFLGMLGILAHRDFKKIEKQKNGHYILSLLSTILALIALIISLIKS